MKILLAIVLATLMACSAPSINPAFKGTEADAAIQKGRALQHLL
jgi:hypothetical protein